MLCFTVALAGLLIFRGAAPADDVPTSLNAGGGGSPPHLTPVQNRPKDAVLDEFLDIARLLEERGARLIGGSRTPKLRRELAEAPPAHRKPSSSAFAWAWSFCGWERALPL